MDRLKKRMEILCEVFASTDKNKDVLIKYTGLWDEIKYLIKTTNGGEAGEYNKFNFMKIRFESDDWICLQIKH